MPAKQPANKIFPIVAIVIGVMLMPAGLMLLLVSLMIDEPIMQFAGTIAAVVQISMGFVVAAAGFLMHQGFRAAKWMFFLGIAGVFANMIYGIVSVVRFIQSS